MADDQKLTKKQLKAQQFRKTKEVKVEEEETKKRTVEQTNGTDGTANGEQPVKKKRKTRRGRGGKGRNGSKGNRFIIFVGSLPRDITNSELQAHFKSSSPDIIRLRAEKGIAFLEFDADKDKKNIQSRMDVALLQHKTLLKDKRINVELTVGGGGNSKDRVEKLRTKNEKMDAERTERLTKMMKEGSKKKEENTSKDTTKPVATINGVHPDRAKYMK